MLNAVHDQPVVDLVGKQDQVMLPSQFHDALQHRPGIDCAGGVVGVDDHNALGLGGDFAAHILQIGVPVLLLVAEIAHRRAPGQRDGGRPQGVVRGGHQHLVPVVQQSLHGHGDQLADAVAGVNIVDGLAGDTLLLAIAQNGLTGGGQTLGVGIALGVGQGVGQGVHHRLRGSEPKGGGVANVQLENINLSGLHALSLVHDGAANIVADMIQLM